MKSVFFLISVFFVIGCGNFFEDKSEAPRDEISSANATVDFAEVKQKIFAPHCIKCHLNYENFASVKMIASGILNSIEQNRMPKNSPPLDESLKILIRTWVAEGANEFLENNSSEQPSDEDITTLKPTWESLRLHIFEPKCLVCHNPVGKAPWIDLSSRAGMAKTLIKHINFKNPDDSNLIIRLRDPEEPMPPLPPQSNLLQLTEDEILVVIDWINSGLP